MYLLRFITSLVVAIGIGCVSVSYAAPTHHKKPHARHVKAQVAKSVNINKVNAKGLAALKGIGPKKAEAIVAYRKQNGAFNSINDLASVKGINKKFIARLEKNNPGTITIR